MPPAISGQRGHDATFRVACILMQRFCLEQTQAMQILHEYNQRCQPPWSIQELQHKLSDAAKQTESRNVIVNALPNAIYEPSNARLAYCPPGPGGGQFKDLETLTKEYIESLRINGKDTAVSTGINSLDHRLRGGFRYGDFVGLGGLSGHLKSGFAQQLGHNITKKEKLPFAFVSLEMAPRHLAVRTIQFASDAPRENWHELTERLKVDLQSHFDQTAEFLIVQSIPTLNDIVETIRRLFEKGTRVVAIDYLQLISPGSQVPPQIVLGQVTERLKRLAEEYNGIIIGLVQLKKDVDKQRGSYIPRMSDIEYGSRFYQAADVCLIGIWPHKISRRMPRDEYHLHLIKQRDGVADAVFKCRIEPSRMRVFERGDVFSELDA